MSAHESYVASAPDDLLPVRGTRLSAAGEDCHRAFLSMEKEYPCSERGGGKVPRKDAGRVPDGCVAEHAPQRLPEGCILCPTCPDLKPGLSAPADCPECEGLGYIESLVPASMGGRRETMLMIKRNKPVECLQWDGSEERYREIKEFAGDAVRYCTQTVLEVTTPHGNAVCNLGDYIFKGGVNDFYPVTAAYVAENYDPA